MKQIIVNHLKNTIGWKTNRKIVVFAIDDYGNVRVDSKKARENMDKAGLKTRSRFDLFDALETRKDLEMLLDALSSVKDKHDQSAVFTPYSLPCNINFEQMADEGYRQYLYELLPQTFEKLSANDPKSYEGAWDLWREGISKQLLAPQFHGREHLNLKVFEEKLLQNDQELLSALKNRSYTSISHSGYQSINYTAAFDFYQEKENYRLQEIIVDGLNCFEQVFGFRATNFMPPTSKIHPMNFQTLVENGIRYIDTGQFHSQHLGNNNYQKTFNYTGKTNKNSLTCIVRNVVFEPTEERGIDWVNFTFRQIEAAFRMSSPAIISSHRVNFCGHIEPRNREKGINALKKLLKLVVRRWPEVEFMSGSKLGDLISK